MGATSSRNGRAPATAVTLLTAVFIFWLIPAAFAGPTPGKEATSPGEKTTMTEPSQSGAKSATAEPSLAGLELKLDKMEALLQAQGERIAALESELRAARANVVMASAISPAAVETAALAAEQEETRQSAKTAPGHQGDASKSLEERLKKFGPFSFSGDLTLRAEPSFGGPADHSQERMRERIRLRFNVEARLNDDVRGGFSLSSGDVSNPISTNQTANQFYTRKPFDLDRAFVTYRPHYLKPLTLTGGKFSYPWYNTELTWDKDLNPEGLAQTLEWKFESTPVLKRIALVGFELPFTETAGVALKNKSIVESVVYGGQLQTGWKFAGWLRFSAYAGFYNWHLADPVALAVAEANSGSPDFGLLRLNSNSAQNSTTTTTGTFVATGQKVVTNAQFASKFGLFDTIARFDIKTPAAHWPVVILGDFVQNTKACANVANILPAPSNTAVETFTQSTNAACDPHQRHGYWLEGDVGRAEEKGDWQFGYVHLFLEREAVLGVFNYSEMRQGSNLTQHRVEAIYQVQRNIQLDFVGLFGRPLVTATSPAEPFVKRLQFNVNYKF